MKRPRILFSGLILISLACSWLPAAVPDVTPTFTSQRIPSLPPLPSEEPITPQALAEEAATEPPGVTVHAPTVLPQPAVARHQTNDPVTLDRITMIDASNGWAISGADVLFTADGAQTWREATPPETLSAGSQVQIWGAFLDAKHAWIIFSVDNQIPVSAVVWHTDDSGRTWTPGTSLEHQVFGEQVWAEFFVLDATHVWLMVRGVYLGAGTHYVGQLLRSTDGGHTWLPLAGDHNYDYTGLVFADSEHGLVTWQTMGAYAPGPPEYAVTSDSGINWEVRELPPPAGEPNPFYSLPYCETFQAFMVSEASIRIVAGCLNGSDPSRVFNSYLYSSEDGGSTWTNKRLPAMVPVDRHVVFFLGKADVLLLDRDIFRSADGGQNWDFVKSVSWEGQFSFVEPRIGWAIARANDEVALVKTSNGGASWMEIKPVIAP